MCDSVVESVGCGGGCSGAARWRAVEWYYRYRSACLRQVGTGGDDVFAGAGGIDSFVGSICKCGLCFGRGEYCGACVAGGVRGFVGGCVSGADSQGVTGCLFGSVGGIVSGGAESSVRQAGVDGVESRVAANGGTAASAGSGTSRVSDAVSDGSALEPEGGHGSGVGDSREGVKLARREKNKRRRNNRRERKNSEPNGCPVPEWRRGASVQSPVLPSGRGFVGSLTEERRASLLASRALMMEKQNRLAAERADRELEVLKATDIEVEKRRQATKLRAAIERNMVSIEKTHATLKATDNVGRDELDHDVHTVVTDGVPSLSSGSISPNSSASMAEYRAVQKQLLDEQKKLSDKEVENEKLYAVLKKIGIEPGVVDYLDKDMWTINSQGTLDDDAKVALEVLAPEGYVIPGQAYVSKGDKVTIRAL